MAPIPSEVRSYAVMQAAASELCDELTIVLSGIDEALQSLPLHSPPTLLLLHAKHAGLNCAVKAWALAAVSVKGDLPKGVRKLASLLE